AAQGRERNGRWARRNAGRHGHLGMVRCGQWRVDLRAGSSVPVPREVGTGAGIELREGWETPPRTCDRGDPHVTASCNHCTMQTIVARSRNAAYPPKWCERRPPGLGGRRGRRRPVDVTTWMDFARSRTDVAAFAADPSRAALVPELTGQESGAGV